MVVGEQGDGRAQPLPVTAEERCALGEWADRGDDEAIARRARIVLGASAGLSNAEVARELGVSRPTVALWRRRFAEGGLEALATIKEGRGRRPSLPPHKTRMILDAAHRPPPAGMTRWTTRSMAAHAGVSPDTVQRLWRDHGVRPPAGDPARGQSHLHRSGLAADAPAAVAPSAGGPPSTNLPQPLSSFVGRRRELAEIEALLAEAGLVTLTGCPGIGKSRLALEVAKRLLPVYEGQACFVALTPVADSLLVAHAVAAALGVTEYSDQGVAETLKAHLRHRRLLLILDDCEHVLPGCAELAATLLAACPALTVLATSQERLGVPGERRWHVPPLALQPLGDGLSALEADGAEGGEAIRLFCERARAQSENSALTQDTVADVAEICRRLDGNPLAIEFAAARAATMGPRAVLQRLDHRFRLLTSGSRAGPARHRTLAGAIGRSFDRLSEPQQVVLRRLSIFEGAISLEAAEHVCSDEALPIDDVFSALTGLVERSLVVAEVTGRQARYRLLETIGEYARGRLAEAGEADRVGDRFADWCGALAEQAELGLTGPGRLEWRARLDAEHDNVVAAIDRMLSGRKPARALTVAGAMAAFWRLGDRARDGLALLERCLDAADGDADALVRAKAARGAGLLAAMLGDVSTARVRGKESLRAAEEAGDDAARARALAVLGAVAVHRGEPTAAVELLTDSVSAARRADHRGCLSDSLTRCGQAHMLQGAPKRAVPMFDEALHIARELGDREAEAAALIGGGWAAMDLGDYQVAEARMRLAQDLASTLRDRFRTGETLVFLGELNRRRGELAKAEAHFRECRHLARAMCTPLLEARALGGLGRVELGRQRYTAALVHFRKGLAIARRVGLSYVLTRMLLGCAACAQAMADPVAAEAALQEVRAIACRNDDRQGTATALHCGASIARDQGHLAHAAELLTEALRLHVEAGDTETIVRSLEELAGVALDEGRLHFAARLFGAAQAASDSRRGHVVRWPRHQQRYDDDVARLEEALGAETLRRLRREGADKPLEKVLAALQHPRVRKRSDSSGRQILTDCELDVARLVAHGLTSREVGERLFVSHRTIDAHLARIYRKLNISSRRQLRELAGQLPELQPVDS